MDIHVCICVYRLDGRNSWQGYLNLSPLIATQYFGLGCAAPMGFVDLGPGVERVGVYSFSSVLQGLGRNGVGYGIWEPKS